MMGLNLLSMEELVDVCDGMGANLVNPNALEILLVKIHGVYKNSSENSPSGRKRILADISATMWLHITQTRPFEENNNITATEVMLYFLKKNHFALSLTDTERVNWTPEELTQDKLSNWIYGRLRPGI